MFSLVVASSWGWMLHLRDTLWVSGTCPGWILAYWGSLSALTDSTEGLKALWEIKSSYTNICIVGWKSISSQKSLPVKPGKCFSLKSQGLGARCLLAAGALTASWHWIEMDSVVLAENNVLPKPGLC